MCFLPRLAALPVIAAISLSSLAFTAQTASADSDILMRKSVGFHDCRDTITHMLGTLKADKENVHLVRDTGAHYRVKLVASEANLVFMCNNVTEQMEIHRTTPGELQAPQTQTASN